MSGSNGLNVRAAQFVPQGVPQAYGSTMPPPDVSRGGGGPVDGYGGHGHTPQYPSGGGGGRGRGGRPPNSMMGGGPQSGYGGQQNYNSAPPPPGMNIPGAPMRFQNNNNNNWQRQPHFGPAPMYNGGNVPVNAEPSRAYVAGPPSGPPRPAAPRTPKMAQEPRSTGPTPVPSPAAAGGVAPTMRAPPPAPQSSVCKVIMVLGYCGSGKTTVAKAIAKNWKYEYVNLKGGGGDDAKDGAEDAGKENGKETEHTNERLTVLDELLTARKTTLRGIVLDDVVVRSRFEAHYVNHILQRHQLGINAVVFLCPVLSTLLARDPSLYKSPEKMSLHPESFELASHLEDVAVGETTIAVVDNEGPVEEVIVEVEAQLKGFDARPPVAVQFPDVELMDKCVLVADPDLVERIINAETEVLQLDGTYGFPYVEPNFLLDYPAFVRSAIQFKNYMVVPWVWGDKVSIIGYNSELYVHLPSFRLVFKMHESRIPTPMGELMKKLQSEREVDEKGVPAQPIMFSLEAAFLDGALHISDMMLIGTTLGSKSLLPDRVKLLRSELGKLPQSGAIRLLEHFPVSKIAQCIDSCSIARGVLFVNPDGMMCGQYDSRNFLYPSDTIKDVRLRVWNGRQDGERWLFDAYSVNNEEEVTVDMNGEKIAIVISDADVGTDAINDGHIVECVLTTDTAPPPKGARRVAAKQLSSFTFVKRCRWESKPITLHYQSQFSSPRAWTTPKLSAACTTITYAQAQIAATD